MYRVLLYAVEVINKKEISLEHSFAALGRFWIVLGKNILRACLFRARTSRQGLVTSIFFRYMHETAESNSDHDMEGDSLGLKLNMIVSRL